MGKTNIMLPEEIGAVLRRLKVDTGADTLTETMANALSVYSELSKLLRGGGSALCLRSADGSLQELRIPSLSKRTGAVELVALEAPAAAMAPSQLFAAEPHGFSVQPSSKEGRLAVASAVLERATGRKPMLLQPAPGRSFPDGTMGPPAPGMLTLEQAAERMGLPPKRLLAALREGSFEGAVKDENDDWWVPASEARPQLA
jgi:hypothetical protein